MTILLRIIGAFLLAMGLLNLASLLVVDADAFRSPVMVGFRYSLMGIAGLGYLLLRRWGVVVFFGSVLINWIAYFAIYDFGSASRRM